MPMRSNSACGIRLLNCRLLGLLVESVQPLRFVLIVVNLNIRAQLRLLLFFVLLVALLDVSGLPLVEGLQLGQF